MNLTKLFETQAKLDEHIMQEHPELKGQNNLDWKLLALQVELGECANEWRGFKKWSKDQKPRTAFEGICECPHCDGFCSNNDDQPRNYVLEEYVDCLHFILSIGLEFDVAEELDWDELTSDEKDLTKQFQMVFAQVTDLNDCLFATNEGWQELFGEFYWLGTLLGFTWEQVEEAYYAKNKVNHDRQNAGY